MSDAIATLIPGRPSGEGLRFLVLVQGTRTPAARALPHGGPGAANAHLEALPLSSALRDALGGVVPWIGRVSGLSPGARYVLDVVAGNAARSLTFRTLDPDADRLEVVVASCYYDGFSMDASYRAALDSVWCRDAAFKLLIGDNVYVDVHERQRDDRLTGGFAETAWVYRRHLIESGYRRVWEKLPTLTTWDDHELWNNYPESVKWLARTRADERPAYVKAGLECLRVFQASLNGPIASDAGDLSFRLAEAPLVDFFFADTRAGRTRFETPVARMMPEAALARLEAWAAGLKRPGVLVIGQPLWIEGGSVSADLTPPNYPEQYERIWRALVDAPFDVLVLSGDVHHSRCLDVAINERKRVIELVSSPVCHIPTLTAIATGGFRDGAQDRGAVAFPHRLEGETGSRLRARYLFGTDAPNTLARVTFRKRDDAGSVEIGAVFLDVDGPARPAPVVKANVGFLGGGDEPVHDRCDVPAVAVLRKRS